MMVRFSTPPTMLASLALGGVLSLSTALAASDAVEKAKKIAVEAPEKLPEESPLTADQVAVVLKGVNWGDLLDGVAGEAGGVQWKDKGSPAGGEGHLFEATLHMNGGDKTVLELSADPGFKRLRLVSGRPGGGDGAEQKIDDPERLIATLSFVYAANSGVPAAAGFMEEMKGKAQKKEAAAE